MDRERWNDRDRQTAGEQALGGASERSLPACRWCFEYAARHFDYCTSCYIHLTSPWRGDTSLSEAYHRERIQEWCRATGRTAS